MIAKRTTDATFMNSYLYRYKALIDEGTIVAGREIKQTLERLWEDLDAGLCYYDDTEPNRVCKFMDSCVYLTKSPFYGKPMQLLLWQRAFLSALLGFRMPDGARRFQRSVLLIGRKNGKTELMAGLLLYFLMAGGKGLEMVCSSCNDNQSSILYGILNTMGLLLDKKQKYLHQNRNQLSCPKMGNHVFRLSDSSRAKEGHNIDFAVIDEAHELLDDGVVQAIEQSQSTKVNPLLLIITTEGFVNNGFLDQELGRAREILRQEREDQSTFRYLPWLYTADSERDIWQGDENNRLWEKANPSLGAIKTYEFLAGQVEQARHSTTKRAFVLAKDFNVKQGSAQAWLNAEDYNYDYPEIDWESLRDCRAVGGVDIAETTDLTCARLLIPVDGKLITTSHYWMPKVKLENSPDTSAGAKYKEWAEAGLLTIIDQPYMDPALASDWFWQWYETYGICPVAIGYDQRFAKAFIDKCKYWGFEPEHIWQNSQTLHPAYKMAEADLKLHKVIGLNDIDKWCIGNATLQINSKEEGILAKIRGQAQKRIDGAVSLGIAYASYYRHKGDFVVE